MAVSSKNNAVLSRLKHVLTLQKFIHSPGQNHVMEQGHIDKSKWRKMDSRNLGISGSMISEASWIVLKILRRAGYEAYLVGGCVRDLILNKVPKDFDVITTAALKQVKKEFHRCLIVGIRFPICRVLVKGSVIEVSSFDTVANHNKEKEHVSIPHGCDMKDYARWRNCMHRDFTVNSLFFDPFESKVYDYANGMMDLRSLKLRTLIPAHLSFKEDSARILRGLRLAARLGLSLSQETEIAIQRLVPSIASLPKARLMMEMNYMLSYGAAEPSLAILQKFKLLEMLLPMQAAYLSQQSRKHQSTVMLMKLFRNLDKLVTCDHPSASNLWVGLLAFHLALTINPQDALVVWTFASVFYHGNWNEGVKFGREHAHRPTAFEPEIKHANHLISDDELAVKVTQLASAVQHFAGCLSHSDNLLQLMVRFPDSPCSGLVFVPHKSQKRASDLFNVLAHDIESYGKGRKNFEIDYKLLGEGNLCETRFVLGKIIMDTMSSGSVQGSGNAEEEHKLVSSATKNTDAKEKPELVTFRNENRKRGLAPHVSEPQKDAKKKKLILQNSNVSEDGGAVKRKRAVNTEFDTLAELEVQLIEKNKKGIRNMLQFVKKHQEHPKIENVEQEGSSEAELEQVKKTTEKVTYSAKKSNLPLYKNQKREEVSENNGGGEGKTGKPEENGEHLKTENVKQQDRSDVKLKPVTKKFKKVISSKEKATPLGKNKKQKRVSENNRGGEGKTEKPEEYVNMDEHRMSQVVKDVEHLKTTNVKWQYKSEAKLKPVQKNVKKVVDSVENSNLPMNKNKKREKVSENDGGGKGKTENPEKGVNKNKKREEVSENNGGGEGKTEKSKEDMNKEKHKRPSLSSMFRG